MLCQGKRAAEGGGATICRIDLYVVGSRQIFTVKILDIVCWKLLHGQRIKKINKLLISASFHGQRIAKRGLRPRFPRVCGLCCRRIVQCACVLDH